MNKIRVIDLLNKIAKGKKVPKKIRFDYNEYEYDEKAKTYYCGMDTLTSKYKYVILNEEVEIIEEENGIPKKVDFNISNFAYKEYELNIMRNNVTANTKAINQIIDYLSSLQRHQK